MRQLNGSSGHAGSPTRGRPFKKGNPGRQRGSMNRATVVANALLRGEEDALVRKAIEVAKGGDVGMLKFLLDRILPRDRTVPFPLPAMKSSDDAVEALTAIMHRVADGTISPLEGAAAASVVNSLSKAINTDVVLKRLDTMEASLSGAEL
jgi:hypothetical protein